ncbi:unnamed protein product, partial [Owenia fusiformis]
FLNGIHLLILVVQAVLVSGSYPYSGGPDVAGSVLSYVPEQTAFLRYEPLPQGYVTEIICNFAKDYSVKFQLWQETGNLNFMLKKQWSFNPPSTGRHVMTIDLADIYQITTNDIYLAVWNNNANNVAPAKATVAGAATYRTSHGGSPIAVNEYRGFSNDLPAQTDICVGISYYTGSLDDLLITTVPTATITTTSSDPVIATDPSGKEH